MKNFVILLFSCPFRGDVSQFVMDMTTERNSNDANGMGTINSAELVLVNKSAACLSLKFHSFLNSLTF